MGKGKWGQEGEGSSQETCTKDPGQWTTGWGLTEGVGGVGEGRAKWGRNWDNSN